MNNEADPVLARLKVLPSRLRIAHLAALLRCARQANGSPTLVCASLRPCLPTAARGEGSTTSTQGGRAG
jgi:hypothetical protein